eukprot:356404-Prymnesium_polylepis.1
MIFAKRNPKSHAPGGVLSLERWCGSAVDARETAHAHASLPVTSGSHVDSPSALFDFTQAHARTDIKQTRAEKRYRAPAP